MHLTVLSKPTAAVVIWPVVSALSGRPALRTTAGIVVKTFLRKKLLLRYSKRKFFLTVAACQITVLIHLITSLSLWILSIGKTIFYSLDISQREKIRNLDPGIILL